MHNQTEFKHDYCPSTIFYGKNCTNKLGKEFDRYNVRKAVIICGPSVGSNTAIIDSIKEKIGDSLYSIYDEASSEKSLQVIFRGLEVIQSDEIDAVVSIGGGSSLDVARAICAFDTDERSASKLSDDIVNGDEFEINGEPPILFAIPTTLAGGDLSMGCSPRFPMKRPSTPPNKLGTRTISISDPVLMPDAIFYDPELYKATPDDVLAGSAINGLNKAIEKLYSPNANPITDATAVRGLSKLQSGLPNFLDDSEQALHDVIQGVILAQYAWYSNDSTKTSILHAFGHGFSRHYPVQQGVVHGIILPHVLRYIFDNSSGRRALLANGLNIDDNTGRLAEEIVKETINIRNQLNLPKYLCEIEGLEQNHLPEIASLIMHDIDAEDLPNGIDINNKEIMEILHMAFVKDGFDNSS